MDAKKLELLRSEFDKFLNSKNNNLTDAEVIKKALETEKKMKMAV